MKIQDAICKTHSLWRNFIYLFSTSFSSICFFSIWFILCNVFPGIFYVMVSLPYRRGVGAKWSLRSHPTQAIPWFYEFHTSTLSFLYIFVDADTLFLIRDFSSNTVIFYTNFVTNRSKCSFFLLFVYFIMPFLKGCWKLLNKTRTFWFLRANVWNLRLSLKYQLLWKLQKINKGRHGAKKKTHMESLCKSRLNT